MVEVTMSEIFENRAAKHCVIAILMEDNLATFYLPFDRFVEKVFTLATKKLEHFLLYFEINRCLYKSILKVDSCSSNSWMYSNCQHV